jgi:hypothetical protein
MLNRTKLPDETEMLHDIENDQVNEYKFTFELKMLFLLVETFFKKAKNDQRFFSSKRHTIQQDPIVYNDQIASFIGANPNFLQNIRLIWKYLLFILGSNI